MHRKPQSAIIIKDLPLELIVYIKSRKSLADFFGHPFNFVSVVEPAAVL